MKSINATHADPTVMCNVRPGRRHKPYDGQRQDLTRDEIDKLFAALRARRNGHRDYMIGLVCFLHDLRVSELIDLRWDDIDWRAGTIRIRRLRARWTGFISLSVTRHRACGDCNESKSPSVRMCSRQSAARPLPGSPSTR